jgi:hypothetical protein
MYTNLSENLKERNHLGDLGVDGNIILKCVLKTQSVRVWSGLNWLRIGCSGGLTMEIYNGILFRSI